MASKLTVRNPNVSQCLTKSENRVFYVQRSHSKQAGDKRSPDDLVFSTEEITTLFRKKHDRCSSHDDSKISSPSSSLQEEENEEGTTTFGNYSGMTNKCNNNSNQLCQQAGKLDEEDRENDVDDSDEDENEDEDEDVEDEDENKDEDTDEDEDKDENEDEDTDEDEDEDEVEVEEEIRDGTRKITRNQLDISTRPSHSNSQLEMETYFTENKVTEISHETNMMTLDDKNGQNTLGRILKDSSISFGDVNIVNSSNIILGNVIYIMDPVTVVRNQINVVQQQTVTQQIFVTPPPKEVAALPNLVTREDWLALPPTGPGDALQTPVPYVVISHTAGPQGLSHESICSITRDIQAYHTSCYGWCDIAYNFLVGHDGSVIEGRGWRLQGAHTRRYNKLAIGVSFIGCFMSELPTTEALEACRRLVEYGVQNGYLQADYKILAHCQLSETRSPGEALYAELQGWPHWSRDP